MDPWTDLRGHVGPRAHWREQPVEARDRDVEVDEAHVREALPRVPAAHAPLRVEPDQDLRPSFAKGFGGL